MSYLPNLGLARSCSKYFLIVIDFSDWYDNFEMPVPPYWDYAVELMIHVDEFLPKMEF